MNIQAKSRQSINWKQIAIVAVVIGAAAFQYWRSRPNAPVNDGGPAGQAVALPDTIDLDGQLNREKKSDRPGGEGLEFDLSAVTKRDTTDNRLDQPAEEAGARDNNSSNARDGSPYLTDGRRGTKVSPAGLVYTGSRSGEHRTEHVLRHASDQPNRPIHGVFDADGDDVFRLIDEAYKLIKNKSRRVTKESPRDGKVAFVVDMKRRIGYLGGQKGKRTGHPAAFKMKLVLAEDRVITAFPL